MGDNERLCALAPCLRLKRCSLQAGLEPWSAKSARWPARSARWPTELPGRLNITAPDVGLICIIQVYRRRIINADVVVVKVYLATVRG